MDGSPLMQISEQLVLVTGAGRGLGQHIAHAFAAQGARVIINYRHSEAAARALASELGGQAIALQADITDRAQVDSMLQHALAHFGQGVTTVVNNALATFSFNGDARDGAADIGWPAFQAQFEGSVRGALNTVQASLPGMQARRFGRVINIGTNLFQIPVGPYHDYTAAKAALLSLTRTLAGGAPPMPAPPRRKRYSTTSPPTRRCAASPPRPSSPMPRCSSPARGHAR